MVYYKSVGFIYDIAIAWLATTTMTQDFKQDFYQQGLTKAKSGDRYGAVQAFSYAIA